jgi:hypothetical protein
MGGAWFSPPAAPVCAYFAESHMAIIMVVANATRDPGGNR